MGIVKDLTNRIKSKNALTKALDHMSNAKDFAEVLANRVKAENSERHSTMDAKYTVRVKDASQGGTTPSIGDFYKLGKYEAGYREVALRKERIEQFEKDVAEVRARNAKIEAKNAKLPDDKKKELQPLHTIDSLVSLEAVMSLANAEFLEKYSPELKASVEAIRESTRIKYGEGKLSEANANAAQDTYRRCNTIDGYIDTLIENSNDYICNVVGKIMDTDGKDSPEDTLEP